MADVKSVEHQHPRRLALPGVLSGLVLRGSTVLGPSGQRLVVDEVKDGCVFTADGAFALDEVVHYLTDRTSRSHAAWWAQDHWPAHLLLSGPECQAMTDAMWGREMSDEQIARLCSLVLRLAYAAGWSDNRWPLPAVPVEPEALAG